MYNTISTELLSKLDLVLDLVSNSHQNILFVMLNDMSALVHFFWLIYFID